ncbi:kinesin KIN-4A [Olea europaea subsp. europaea]|uniref:Kinesin KIN-4A n=1 Tax=Olea europaea subsp. europaea TaxID=158383 RepID=A0A8S0UEJ1_OLEEU|nr:kinesin KIN-4A [Olea europaea subsp. europaea]
MTKELEHTFLQNTMDRELNKLNRQLEQKEMVPIGPLSMKKLAKVGHVGKLWRWKRSHHRWLLQFKWKRQKP